MNINNVYKKSILNYLKDHYTDIFNFWTKGEKFKAYQKIQDHCDFIYIVHLADLFDIIDHKSIKIFKQHIREINLPIYSQNHSIKSLSIHNTAYLLGALNLLRFRGFNLYPDLNLLENNIDILSLLNSHTKQPVYPPVLSHHIWRVSHWIGGIPSIMYSLIKANILPSKELNNILNQTMSACDNLIDNRTGLLKTYKNEYIQWLFKQVYSMRHNPDLGDIGGIAHLHWINYLLNRPYKRMEILFEKSIKLFLECSPFMEKTPYCLDFDIVQIIRTSLIQGAHLPTDAYNRITRMINDIEIFIMEKLNINYKIHKLPGALATYHECALLLNLSHLNSFECSPRDIIKEAYWL